MGICDEKTLTMTLSPQPTKWSPNFGHETDWPLVRDTDFSDDVAVFLHNPFDEVESHLQWNVLARCLEPLEGRFAGQLHAEQMLRQQQKIAAEWRGYRLLFPGTIRHDKDGNQYSPCLCWQNGIWLPYWERLQHFFGNFYRIVCTI